MIAHARFFMPDDKHAHHPGDPPESKPVDVEPKEAEAESEADVDGVTLAHAFDVCSHIVVAFVESGNLPDPYTEDQEHHALFNDAVKLVRSTIKHFEE